MRGMIRRLRRLLCDLDFAHKRTVKRKKMLAEVYDNIALTAIVCTHFVWLEPAMDFSIWVWRLNPVSNAALIRTHHPGLFRRFAAHVSWSICIVLYSLQQKNYSFYGQGPLFQALRIFTHYVQGNAIYNSTKSTRRRVSFLLHIYPFLYLVALGMNCGMFILFCFYEKHLRIQLDATVTLFTLIDVIVHTIVMRRSRYSRRGVIWYLSVIAAVAFIPIPLLYIMELELFLMTLRMYATLLCAKYTCKTIHVRLGP
jgi:hypothetical protein